MSELINLTKQYNINKNELIKKMISDEGFRDSIVNLYHNGNLNQIKNNLDEDDYEEYKWHIFLLLCYKVEGLEPYLEKIDLLPSDGPSYLDAAIEMFKSGFTNLNNIFNVLSKTTTLERTGWVEQKIPTKHLESIAEHMYMMMWLTEMYLPESNEYHKQDVKTMCFLHDIGETLMGDINYLVKNKNDDMVEDLKVKSLLLGLLYCKNQMAETYLNLWDEWTLKETYTSKIAHDMDTLQLNYQFHNYATMYPEGFTDEEVKTWLIRFPKTDIGKSIYQILVDNNPKFVETLKRIHNV